MSERLTPARAEVEALDRELGAMLVKAVNSGNPLAYERPLAAKATRRTALGEAHAEIEDPDDSEGLRRIKGRLNDAKVLQADLQRRLAESQSLGGLLIRQPLEYKLAEVDREIRALVSTIRRREAHERADEQYRG